MPMCHRLWLATLTHMTTPVLTSLLDVFSSTTSTSSSSPSSSSSSSSSIQTPTMTSNDTLWKAADSSANVTLAKLLNVTFQTTFPGEGGGAGNGTGEDVVPWSLGKASSSNNSLFIKIVLLLILTAVVLLSTYKFVVRLFSGYSERKDDSGDFYIGIHDES